LVEFEKNKGKNVDTRVFKEEEEKKEEVVSIPFDNLAAVTDFWNQSRTIAPL
jgi:hypothetical protein